MPIAILWAEPCDIYYRLLLSDGRLRGRSNVLPSVREKCLELTYSSPFTKSRHRIKHGGFFNEASDALSPGAEHLFQWDQTVIVPDASFTRVAKLIFKD